MPVHTLSDALSKPRVVPGSFSPNTSEQELWRRSCQYTPTGYQPPVLTLDPKSDARRGFVAYRGSSDSPSHVAPDNMHWRLKTNYQVDLPLSVFGREEPSKRISILQMPLASANTDHDMSAPKTTSSGRPSAWSARLAQRPVTILTDQGGKWVCNLDSELQFDQVSSSFTKKDFTMRSALLNHLAPHVLAGAACSVGVQSRDHEVQCQVPTASCKWTTEGSVNPHKLIIKTDGSQNTSHDQYIAMMLLKSDNSELDKPFALSGKETKIIDASYYPTVQLCLEPLPDPTPSRHGPGHRLGGAKPEGRGKRRGASDCAVAC